MAEVVTDIERVRQRLVDAVVTAKAAGYEVLTWICLRRDNACCCCLLGTPLVVTGFGTYKEPWTLGDFIGAASAALGITYQQANQIMNGFDLWKFEDGGWVADEWFRLGQEFGRREFGT